MSIHSVKQYQAEVEKIIHYGGTKKETAIRTAFQNLLNEYAKQKGLLLIPEITIRTAKGKNVTPDGTLKDSLRQDWGYWESKDEADDIDEEIRKKFAKDYPKDNILFEDSKTAVLFQGGNEKLRVTMEDEEALHRIINIFINYERPEVQNFRKAIELFKQDVPKVTETLRGIIESQAKTNKKFTTKRTEFHELCKEAINPLIAIDDINEMMIQHILTADIFNTIFDEPHFHRENNIAKELEKVLDTFFTGSIRKLTLGSIQHYYKAMNAAAAGIADHHEKQKFLKVVYETFYKSYNPKAADRLGVVYTPNEIVRFMIESTDFLLHKHFNKFLEDKNVEILDPATGTGTYICEIIDYIRPNKLEYKYKNEIHANEVAILPYYIANLNIEFTYKQKMNSYAEFESLCFVDTLDNMGFSFKGKQTGLFGVSLENSQRIKRQNEKKISVIIGNPPYNANQANENDNNKNRTYEEIDKRIKNSFIKNSTAQKTKVYDMYSRFYRWAFDRLDSNGIIAYITNRSFIDSRTFDGFRKCVQEEFDYCYIIDTKSDVRANPKIAGTTHNIFGIQTGVAIMFLVKKQNRENKTCKINYVTMDDFWLKEQKLQWFIEHPLKEIDFETISPDKNCNWLDLTQNDYELLLPLVEENGNSIFFTSSNGVNTARDEWVFDFSKTDLVAKVQYFSLVYNNQIRSKITVDDSLNYSIKWSDGLKQYLKRKELIKFDNKKIIDFNYRPFVKQWYYSEKITSDRLTAKHYQIFGSKLISRNVAITFSGNGATKPFSVLASNKLFSFDSIEKTQSIFLSIYNDNDKEVSNITEWGLQKFQNRYQSRKITKEEIFHYVYAVLHDPAYRTKYELNLKREFPRIPFYDDFTKWSKWGKQLMDLHINYEDVRPFKLREITNKDAKNTKAKLKALKEEGTIIIDDATTLTGIPSEAWEYKLGNRSALEWVLDQYKESKPKDPTIAEKFNTYKFSDYKEHVIDLLRKVCTVSVETMGIIKEMTK
ncbi:MAG: N-6 DNA methylase [Cytophagales bacterium]|nr:N-6 DNA methylase [Cytophagales bacterium]